MKFKSGVLTVNVRQSAPLSMPPSVVNFSKVYFAPGATQTKVNNVHLQSQAACSGVSLRVLWLRSHLSFDCKAKKDLFAFTGLI